MSTYLALCQKLRQQTVDAGTGPGSVLSNTGELARFVQWIADAWSELQQDREGWLWMRKSFTCPTVASTGDYAYDATGLVDTISAAAITRFSHWYKYKFTAYLASDGVAGEYPLRFQEWDTFKRFYRFGAQTDAQPLCVSIDPTMRFCLGPKPDAVYTISGDYQIGPQILAADSDTPEMPSRFHDLIMYEAMSKYGGHRVAPEAMLRAVSEGGRLRSALEMSQLPPITFGEPLA